MENSAEADDTGMEAGDGDAMSGEGEAGDAAEGEMEDAAGADATGEAGSAVYSVTGTQPGYFIAAAPVALNGVMFETVQVTPPSPECDEPASIFLRAMDTNDVIGTSDEGDVYQGYAMDIDSYAVTPDGVSILASHPELGSISIEGDYEAAALAGWQGGADAVDTLFTADVTVNGDSVSDVDFGFWIGD